MLIPLFRLVASALCRSVLGIGGLHSVEADGPGKSDAQPLPLEGCCYNGDSGGPIFARENDQWRVLGVNSFGTDYPLKGRRATTQYGDVNCSTRVPNHVDWIHRTIAGETDGPKDK